MEIVCRQFADILTRESPGADERADPVIVCRTCGQAVTDPEQQMTMDGGFVHAFANPLGQVFEIGCFRQAPGCAAASAASTDFTWFAGYAWQVGICVSCAGHLGWIFIAGSHRFFGLILERLRFP
jgi:hypothetical protein